MDNLSIVEKTAGPNVSFIQRVHKEEDNLSIVDKMAGPNVSFIQRLQIFMVRTCTWHNLSPELGAFNIFTISVPIWTVVA